MKTIGKVMVWLGVTAAVAIAGPSQAACSKVNPTRPGEVFLWRGLANVFSLGMDQMAKDFTRLGIENCVFNHNGWSAAAQELVERKNENRPISYPIIIIGHSLGAGASPEMATYLGRHGIPVTYVVMYDPVVPTQVGANVQEIVNYYIRKPDKDKILYPMADFSGKLENIDLSGRRDLDHFNIDKNSELHKIAYARVIAASDAVLAGASAQAPAKKKAAKK
jgi:thioesterase domain-containing protein